MPEPPKPTPQQVAAAEAELAALLPREVPPCSEPLLALGILTLPVLVRTPLLRSHHRATHYSQRPAQRGRICLKYVVSDVELSRIKPQELLNVSKENATFNDMLVVPSVPAGRLRRMGLRSDVLDHSVPPAGAGCVYKILSWMQHAAKAWPRAPFIAYADDDTYWSLTRVEQSLGLLRPAEAATLRIYAGTMQYHAWWDFRKMESHGWFFGFPAAAKMLQDPKQFVPSEAMPPNATREQEAMASRFHWPYPMAHGLGVLFSRGLAAELPESRAVAAFMKLYDHWLHTSPTGADVRRNEVLMKKCRLGTDSTIGSWVRAHATWGHDGGGDKPQVAPPPLVAVDLLGWNMMWPWPLPDRCHSSRADWELQNAHAFHLYGKTAKDPTYWRHIHQHMARVHEQQPSPPPPPPMPTAQQEQQPSLPRLHCRHAPDATNARVLLRSWQAAGAAATPTRPSPWLERHAKGVAISKGARLDPAEWLFCGITCVENSSACQRDWPDLRRR